MQKRLPHFRGRLFLTSFSSAFTQPLGFQKENLNEFFRVDAGGGQDGGRVFLQFFHFFADDGKVKKPGRIAFKPRI